MDVRRSTTRYEFSHHIANTREQSVCSEMPWTENMPLTLAKYMQTLIWQPKWICVFSGLTKRIKPKTSRLYPEITDPTGKKNIDPEGVAEAFASHYETLYSYLMDQHFDDGTKKYIDTNFRIQITAI